MCESYARSLMRVAVAQLCQALGWDAVQLSACELLSDVLERYLQQLARGCHRYSELCESPTAFCILSTHTNTRPEGMLTSLYPSYPGSKTPEQANSG